MEKSFWEDHWQRGHIPFHQDQGNALLREFYPSWHCGDLPILVPLCGKTADMLWLAQKGHRVIGVEMVERAAREFFETANIDYIETTVAGHLLLKGGDIEIWVSDILSIEPELLPGPLRSMIARHWSPCPRRCASNTRIGWRRLGRAVKACC